MIGGCAVAFGGGAVLQGELVAAPSVGSDALLHLQRSVVGACVAITVLCKSYSKLKLCPAKTSSLALHFYLEFRRTIRSRVEYERESYSSDYAAYNGTKFTSEQQKYWLLGSHSAALPSSRGNSAPHRPSLRYRPLLTNVCCGDGAAATGVGGGRAVAGLEGSCTVGTAIEGVSYEYRTDD